MIEGRVDWTGKDPEVIKLTDNGVRKVQIRLVERGRLSRPMPFELAITISDPDRFAREFEEARAWMKEG